MILFKAEAILASNMSKFGKFFPAIDREDFMRMYKVKGICRIAVPISAVFAVQPWNSAESPPGNNELMVDGFLQMSTLELCPYFHLHLL